MMWLSFPSAPMTASSSSICSLSIRPLKVNTTSPFAVLSILNIPFPGPSAVQVERHAKLIEMKGIYGELKLTSLVN